jgi:hypothetical protein
MEYMLMDPMITKELLQCFESKNQTREDFDLKGLCDDQPLLFGERGSDKRRLVQKRWNRIKAKTPLSYLKFLHSFPGVVLGRTTLKETQEARKRNDMTKSTDLASDTSSHSSTPSEMDHRYSSPLPSHGQPTHNLRSSKHTPPRSFKNTPPRSPLVPEHIGIGLGQFSSTKHDTPQSSCQHVFGATSALVPPASSSLVELSWSSFQNGTIDNPWVRPVDIRYPERNAEFDIQFVEQMSHGVYERKGFHIRKTVVTFDWDLYEASIPSNYPLELSRRLILVKGPSRSFWENNSDMYHGTGMVDCDMTRKAHTATEILLEKNHARQWQYWLLVFPQGTVLDNQIFSEDEDIIPMEGNPVMSDGKTNDFGKDIRGMVVYWCIAVAGGRRVENSSNRKKNKDMYKK